MWLKAGLAGLAVLAGAFVAPASGANARDFRVEYVFKVGSDGYDPEAALTEFGGKLYGTTLAGGDTGPICPTSGCGTVFSFDPATGAESVLHAFHGVHDGALPSAGLVGVGDALYGAANDPFTCGCGVLFRVNPATGGERIVYRFQGGADGSKPTQMSPIRFRGMLYGTTWFGGGGAGPGCASSGCGVVFSFDPKTGVENVVYGFQGGADGAEPTGRLVEVGGIFYGVASFGGGSAKCASGCGAVYSVDPANGREVVLYGFQGGADGAGPSGGLIAVGGLLYGTTSRGGSSIKCRDGCGTVFSFDPATGVKTIVHAFPAPKNGYNPVGELIKVATSLYGVTLVGGHTAKGTCDAGCGTLYSIDLQSGVQRIVHSSAPDAGAGGAGPHAGLTYTGGRLFGTTGSAIYSFIP